MNKRGNVFKDMILIPIMLFLIAVVILTANIFWVSVKDDTTIFNPDNEYQARIKAATQTTVNMYPFIFVMVLAAMLAALALTGYFVESNPVFLVVGIIIIMITIIVAVPLSNAHQDMVTGDLAQYSFSIINSIVNNMAKVVLFIGMAFLLALYSKRTGAPGL